MQGLQNLGSTCAINSLIQIICRTDQLRSTILNNNVPENSLSAELKDILHLMHNCNHSLSPKKFIVHLFQHLGAFQMGEQIDIGELWMFLFDKLANEMGEDLIVIKDESLEYDELSYCDIYDNNKIANNKKIIELCESNMLKYNNNKTSKWLDTSQGIMLSIIKCDSCDNIEYIFEPFISISLDFPESHEIPSIASMFRNYLKTQTACEGWNCDKCKKYSTYTKSLKIWKMPKVLIFVIKRFINIHSKNNDPVCINKTLCIKKGSVLSDLHIDYNYKCDSMAYHLGNMTGGHYCAISRVNDNYILYDDLNVNIINTEQIENIFQSNRDAYMLVYSL